MKFKNEKIEFDIDEELDRIIFSEKEVVYNGYEVVPKLVYRAIREITKEVKLLKDESVVYRNELKDAKQRDDNNDSAIRLLLEMNNKLAADLSNAVRDLSRLPTLSMKEEK